MNRTDNEIHRCNDDESNKETFTDKVKKSLPHLKRDVNNSLKPKQNILSFMRGCMSLTMAAIYHYHL